MRSPCLNPLAYLDYSCDGCTYTHQCECDLRIVNGKRLSTQKKVPIAPSVIPAPVLPPVEVVEVVAEKKKKVFRKASKIEVDLDI